MPETFIDDALERFKEHELRKLQQTEESSRKDSTADISDELRNAQSTSSLNEESSSNRNDDTSNVQVNKSVSLQNISATTAEERKKVVDIDDHNRTMVLQVDRTDLRLISPDRKVVLMHKHHKEVTGCLQGLNNTEHFGFVCRESTNQSTYIGFIFKCESQSVAADAVQAITQAFANADTRPFRNAVTSCEHCPMIWYHKLCTEVEHLSDRKTQATIFRKYVIIQVSVRDLISFFQDRSIGRGGAKYDINKV